MSGQFSIKKGNEKKRWQWKHCNSRNACTWGNLCSFPLLVWLVPGRVFSFHLSRSIFASGNILECALYCTDCKGWWEIKFNSSMPHLISDTHSSVCWLLCPPSHVLIYFVLLLSAQVDKGLCESLSLALVAAVLRVYHRAGRTEGSAVIKWNADHLSTISHNPAAYLTLLPSAVLNSGCVDDKRNTDNNPKFHHRARRPWLQHRLYYSRKPLEIPSYFLLCLVGNSTEWI